MADVSLPDERLKLEVYLISTTTVVAIFYAFTCILYCLSFRLSFAQFRDDHGKIRRQTVFTLIFQTVLLICATLDVIMSNRIAQIQFVDNITLPGGPLGLPASLSVEAIENVDSVGNMVEDLLILGVLLWRVSVVWSGTRFVMPLTIVSVFLYLANAAMGILYKAISWNDFTNVGLTSQAEFTIFLVAMILSITSLVFMTSMIIARLLFIRRKHINLIGRSDVARQYLGIAAMLIESYALDTLWNIGILISFGLKYAPALDLFNTSLIQVDILTNFLVIYRVLSGRAWTRKTQGRLSTLRWASDGAGASASGTVDLCQTSELEENPPVVSFRNGV